MTSGLNNLGLRVRMNSTVSQAPCWKAISGTAPQTETSPETSLQIKTSLRRPAIDIQSEAWDPLRAGTRSLNLRVFHLLPVHESSQPACPLDRVLTYKNLIYLLNLQFSRIVKPAAYFATRPVSQEVLRRWERCAREGTYTVNHAAGFRRCASEIQDQMTSHITFLPTHLSKGKSAKEVSDALKELRDLHAFHQNVSVSLGTALQYLADSLFVQLGNFILMPQDSYLDHVNPGMKMDTWNAPLFGYGLFPDAALNIAEQDINKFEAQNVSAPSQVGPQLSQKPKYGYKPYDKKDSKPMVQSSANPQQPWRQFGSRGRGRGSINHCFSKYARGGKNFKWQSLQRPTVSVRLKCFGSKPKFSKQHSKDCVLMTCCNSCSYCRWYRAAAKERPKSRSLSDRNKACKKCFFCLSLSFCPSCSKCPQCCRKFTCRRQVTKVLGNMAQPGFKSLGGLHLEWRLQPPVQDEAPIEPVHLW